MRWKRAFGVALATAVAFTAAAHVTACGNGANDVAGCQQLESARCQFAQKCGIDLNYPLHDSNESDVTACQLYYQDACLHGFVTTVAITSAELTSCLDAIDTGDCSTVLNPELNPKCAWLNPPDAGSDVVDASTTTDVTSTVDVVVVVTTEDANDGAADALAACYASCSSMCVDDPTCQTSCEQDMCQGM